jgi:hypothetical protein
VIDGKQYDFNGFKYIPDAFKLKYMNQNKVKDDKIELEDDQMLFITNEGLFVFNNEHLESERFAIILNPNHYANY